MAPRRWAALALATAPLAACGPAPGTPVVVWIEVDTLRADALGCYGNEEIGYGGVRTSPVMDALAAESVRFERAYSPAPWTIPSLATQFTGLWPGEHGALRIAAPVDPGLESLAERFSSAGWRTAAVTGNLVTRRDVTPGFDAGFETWSDEHAAGHEGSPAFDEVRDLLRRVDTMLEDPGEGLFLFALLFEPHFRYVSHEGFRFEDLADTGYIDGGMSLAELRALRGEFPPGWDDVLRDLYLSEVAYADAAIGALLDGLRERGLFDDALVVVVADHGEELMERGWIGHTVTLFDELVRVPLVLKLPGNAHAGAVVPDMVSLVDLPATVLDYASQGANGLGRSLSLRGLIEGGERPRRYLLLHSDFEPPLQGDSAQEKRTLKWGVVDGSRDLKYVEDRLAGTAHLYDLTADPGERVNLAGTGRSEEAELADVLRRLERGEEVE